MKLRLSEIIRKKLLCMPIRDTEARHKIRDGYIESVCQKRLQRQKWGVSYSVFDGEELLEASLQAIRNSVQHIVVVYQLVSWYGVPASPQLLPLLQELKGKGLIDELLEFKPKLGIKAVRNETAKRNMGLRACRKAGCTFYMAMDSDEFYLEKEIEAAKHFIIMHDVTHSYCSICTHGLNPASILPTNTYYVQFFSRISRFSRHMNDGHSVALVDPTRKMKHLQWWQGGSKHYVLHNVRMHHYSYIRKDLKKKFNNSSHSGIRNYTKDNVISYESYEGVDYFNLGQLMETWDKE